ncbi:Xaa-Pro aminopeptidase [Vairimorpha necatrix]|uniref:Xaa-Pro aminopeptidase n=1 Tax=Vairimorpha necatrix TaxID=6039 RepID=A0AAX4JG66_9MICR
MLLQSFLELIRQQNLDAYINPIRDEHFNEVIGDNDQRVKSLTGYTGTYGSAITGVSNAFFTTMQFLEKARTEIKNFEVVEELPGSMINWITSKGIKRIGVCSKLITSREYKRLHEDLQKVGVTLVPYKDDLFDQVWSDKPKKKFNPIFSLQDIKLSEFIDKKYIAQFKELIINEEKPYNLDTIIPGETYIEKLQRLRKNLKKGEGFILSNMSTISWILNLRGNDLKHSTSFYSFAYFTDNSFTLFTEDYIKMDGITFKPYNSFYDFVKDIKEKKVYISDDVNFYTYSLLKNPEYSEIIENEDAYNNPVEVFGFKMAGIHDAVSIIKLLSMFENSEQDFTELEIKKKLLRLKKKNPGYYSESFEPIIASGINSAKIFHEVSKKIHTKDELLLIDVGSHYYYGTTDITRTVCFGNLTPDMIRFYTVTAKALTKAKSIRKSNIKGKELDEAVRYYFKQMSKDFITATGHGVRHFSNVHENIPKLGYEDDILSQKNVFTLEPFYQDSSLGIRLEDEVLINEDSGFVFQTNLSYVPLQLNLIDNAMLTAKERKMINLYSRKMREFLTPKLKSDALAYKYLLKNTEQLPDVEQTKDVNGDLYGMETK